MAPRKKVLLMGKSGSGKTSMRSIVFANFIARDTRRLGATIDVEQSHVRFLGNLQLNLWDCGGQSTFMENYLTSQRDQIFSNVEVLIYVFDVESREVDKDLMYYQNTVDALTALSKGCKVFCLIHKMDLLPEEHRELIFQERFTQIKNRSYPLNVSAFKTSIWDETLYKAWSAIVHELVPNVHSLETQLESFCKACDADEVVLFERTTFLVISHSTRKNYQDSQRFEKVSNIVKQFKLSCNKASSQFKSMEIKNPEFTVFIEVLTQNTVIMVIMSDPSIQSSATLINISAARQHFNELEAGPNAANGARVSR
ncbi:ras-related GTP-binding protein A [Cladochytrium replicatum]|nr:ras-related GTP-binding protein A [Cladochytrium replicatum]